jgi:16S rRNA (guanine527-N7)-methyltransferase
LSAAAVPDAELADRIAGGADALSIPLDPRQVESLVAYLRLVERWNATYNLTSVRDPRAMVTQHVLDCLAAAAALRRRRAPERRRRTLDVGSGAGLPGVVFAVAMADSEVVCIDSVGKKAAFITQAAAAIGARNVTALHGRVERLDESRFDVIASRAFASLDAFVASTRHLLAENGEWLAMKGKAPTAEVAALSGVRVEIEPLVVPFLDAERCAVWVRFDK